MNNQLALESQVREYQLARNRWFAYKNSPEFIAFPDGIASNIISSGMYREKRKLDELQAAIKAEEAEKASEDAAVVPVKRTTKRKATVKA